MTTTEQSPRTEGHAPEGPGPTGGAFASLGVRNYRLWFVGQLISMCGSWMQGTAQAAYIVYRLHGRGAELGILSALMFVPMMLFSIPAGVLVDRLDKRRLMIGLQSYFALVALAQTIMVATGTATIRSIYVLTFLGGCATALEMPTRHSFVSELVPNDRLANAIGLNSMLIHGGRIIGQSLGGVLVPIVGYAWCFGINTGSFVAVVIGLVLMRGADIHRSVPAPRAGGQTREGLAYIRRTPTLRTVLSLLLLIGLFSFNFQTLLPLMAKQEFHGGPRTVGLFQAMLGVGSFLGAFLAARRGRPVPRYVPVSALVMGLGLLGLAGSPRVGEVMALGALVVTGVSFLTLMQVTNATLQLSADPSMRGRVMAVYTFALTGTTPLGAPLLGWFADRTSAPTAIAFASTVLFVAAAWSLRSLRRGLLAPGLGSAG